MKDIYLDHAATTYVREEVLKEMEKYFTEVYGNPGSFNSIGLKAKEALDKARDKIKELLNAPSEKNIIFTSGGTESINLAIKGVARSLKKKGNHIITSKVEHHAVLETCKYLEEEGFEVTYLDPDQYGIISVEQLIRAIKSNTILVSLMYANNEIGSINPIKELAEICKSKRIYFHTDACQAGCLLNIDVKELNIDLMTLNSSKLYGPKGVGLLYIKTGILIKPIIHGGGQEFGLRSGTENVPGIMGFAKALELAQLEREEENKRLGKLSKKLTEGILNNIPKTVLNGHPKNRLSNNVNISFLDIEGEALLLYLNEHGFCASSGSACTSKTLDPSHVIIATGVPYEFAHGSLRITLGKKTSEEDIDLMISVLPKIVEKLRLISPFNLKMEEVKINAR